MFRTILLSLLVLTLPCAAQNQGLSLQSTTIGGYVQVPHDPSLAPSSITVEAWMTYDGSTIPSGWAFPTLIRKNMTASQEVYFLRVEAGNFNTRAIKWRVNTASGSVILNYSFAAGAFSSWTHIAATYDGAMSRLFINGVQVMTAIGSGPMVDTGGMVHIGAGDTAPNSAWEVWNGQLDEVRIWPRARTAAEILSMMNIETTAIPGGVSNWTFNNDSLDWSGNNHGTVAGTPAFAANTLSLNLGYPTSSAVSVGTQTNCRATTIQMGIAALPNLGNNDFGVTCIGAPSNANGNLLATIGSPLSSPTVLLGLSFWVDPFAPGTLTFPVLADTRGSANYPVPIPNIPAAVGLTASFQYGWYDFGCNPPIVLADALAIIILP
ncbi:MAG: LamG domain-containing protein [Planctomycetes bacterium]|nr:LamG domain-containing protein [Planctomycetota bacterium]